MEIRDYRIKGGMKASELVEQMSVAGFQASRLADAARVIRKMREEKATIFLSFTANMVASGLRGIITRMVKDGMVDVIITTGGSIDHDLIRAEKPYLLGDFDMDDVGLHKKGINRLGNILVPNDRYIFLEKFMQKIFGEIYKTKKSVSPSELILEIGKNIRDENSFLHWASRRGIPVFCPGITDSAIGLQLYFFKQNHPDFRIDVSGDTRLGDIVVNSERTGGIILGGGIAKHHAIAVNILRGGLDYAVYITTSQPWDGSLSGATSNEAKSWSKIKEKGNTVTVYGDAAIIFPLIMAKVFDTG